MFDDYLSYKARPGQFLMVWIPRKEEIPLSVMISDSVGEAAITIRRNGLASTSLFNLKEGETIGIRGPYGNSFSTEPPFRNRILIGGGTGLVPLIRLLNHTRDSDVFSTVIVGARSSRDLFFIDLISCIMKDKKHKLLISTEDGSIGFKGYPTELLNYIIDKDPKIDIIYTCGPELMMKGVYDRIYNTPIQLEASLERYMKCGIGICSSCSIDDKLVCIDGTIFNKCQLSKLSEFGHLYRNKSGILVSY
jgi:dihydroorotate dehydrogenase electron transfer subunit